MTSRLPWPNNFPNVVVHGKLNVRNRHPDFQSAKAGHAAAAVSLVRDLVHDTAICRLNELLAGRRPLVLPVTAIEATGFNAIPDAMAHEVGFRLGLQPLIGQILQSNKVAHSFAGGWHRLATPATFIGEIAAGSDYLLVDDHVGFGGTLANLRGHVERSGGRVVGMTALTETGGGREIAIRASTLSMLRLKHGEVLEEFWRRHFAHGLDCLTELEGGYLCRVESFDAIRTRLAEAAQRACRGGFSAIEI